MTADRVLLLWNSQNAESQAVRVLFVAALPGVLELNLNDTVLAPAGAIPRPRYLARVRQPVLDYLAGTHANGEPLSEWVICIATTRGLPARIQGADELSNLVTSTFASVESELTLAHQDLEQPAPGLGGVLHAGVIDNPYHRLAAQPIAGFDRSSITTARAFTNSSHAAFNLTGLTPGDMYLVVRIDAAPSADGSVTGVESVAALLERSAGLRVEAGGAQGVFDEFACADHLDDDGFAGLFPAGLSDFEDAAAGLGALGIGTFSDATSQFYEGDEVPDQATPLLVVCSYGKNHSPNMCGAPASDTYVHSFTNLHPAAFFHSIESFNGDSIIDGTPRQNHGQVLDFLAQGGSFTIGNVAEPFSFSVPDADMVVTNLYAEGLTFAEAAWSAIPALSWQQTPVGDPLARVTVVPDPEGDMNSDGGVDTADLGYLLARFSTDDVTADINGDCTVNTADLGLLLSNFGVEAAP